MPMKKFYISRYYVTQHSGGPEEGGWYYDWYDFEKVYQIVRLPYSQEAAYNSYYCECCDKSFPLGDLKGEECCPCCGTLVEGERIIPKAWPQKGDKLCMLLERAEKFFNRCFRYGYSSVLGGQKYTLIVESYPGEWQTKERPYYS